MIRESNGLFRCDCSLCKNFADFELVIGGYKGTVSLCEEHFENMASEIRNILKPKRMSREK